MFNFRIPDNFYNVGSDGIVPQPDNYSGDDSFESCHSILDVPIGEAVYGFQATATYRDLLSSIKMYNTDTTDVHYYHYFLLYLFNK